MEASDVDKSSVAFDQYAQVMLERYLSFCASPPDGWYNFGHHVDQSDTELEFHGEDLNGLPIWERPVVQSEEASDVAK